MSRARTLFPMHQEQGFPIRGTHVRAPIPRSRLGWCQRLPLDLWQQMDNFYREGVCDSRLVEHV